MWMYFVVFINWVSKPTRNSDIKGNFRISEMQHLYSEAHWPQLLQINYQYVFVCVNCIDNYLQNLIDFMRPTKKQFLQIGSELIGDSNSAKRNKTIVPHLCGVSTWSAANARHIGPYPAHWWVPRRSIGAEGDGRIRIGRGWRGWMG